MKNHNSLSHSFALSIVAGFHGFAKYPGQHSWQWSPHVLCWHSQTSLDVSLFSLREHTSECPLQMHLPPIEISLMLQKYWKYKKSNHLWQNNIQRYFNTGNTQCNHLWQKNILPLFRKAFYIKSFVLLYGDQTNFLQTNGMYLNILACCMIWYAYIFSEVKIN